MADFSPDALSSEGIYCQTQLRNHQIVDGPILSQRRGYADLSYDDRPAYPLQTTYQPCVDVKDILIEYQIRLETLYLGEENLLGIDVQTRT